MKKYTSRLAENTDGDRIQELVDPDGKDYPGVTWDKVYPWWAVVLDEGEIIACAQLITSKPVGHIEFLNLDPKLSDMQRAYAIKVLVNFAQILFYSSEVFVSRSAIPHDLKPWKNYLKKRYNSVHQFNASVYDLRLH